MGQRTIVLLLSLMLSLSALADTLKVGVKVSEPFVFQNEATFSGDAIDVWANTFVGESIYVPFTTVDGLLEAVENGEVDVAVGALTVTAEREAKVDFLHPFHQTGLTYATLETQSSWDMFTGVMGTILKGTLVISAAMIFIGMIYTRIEFGTFQHLLLGTYWASATVTTVGYGDEAPQSSGGKLYAIFAMWFGLVISGALTGLIVVSTNTQTVADFNILKSDVAVVEGSAGLHYVENLVKSHKIHVYDTIHEAFQAVESGKVDAVIHDEALLQFMSITHPKLYVSPETFNNDSYAFAVPNGWEGREKLNVSLLKNNKF